MTPIPTCSTPPRSTGQFAESPMKSMLEAVAVVIAPPSWLSQRAIRSVVTRFVAMSGICSNNFAASLTAVGIIAQSIRATAPKNPVTTTPTAKGRGTLRFVRDLTTGSSPSARNNAIPM